MATLFPYWKQLRTFTRCTLPGRFDSYSKRERSKATVNICLSGRAEMVVPELCRAVAKKTKKQKQNHQKTNKKPKQINTKQTNKQN